VQTSAQKSIVHLVSGMYFYPTPAISLRPSTSSGDKLFGIFSTSSVFQIFVSQYHPLPLSFLPPLPPSRPMTLLGNLPGSVLAQQ